MNTLTSLDDVVAEIDNQIKIALAILRASQFAIPHPGDSLDSVSSGLSAHIDFCNAHARLQVLRALRAKVDGQ